MFLILSEILSKAGVSGSLDYCAVAFLQASTMSGECWSQEQFHPREEVCEMIEDAVELTIHVKQIARPGLTRPVSFAWPVELPTPNVELAQTQTTLSVLGQDPHRILRSFTNMSLVLRSVIRWSQN